MRLAFNKGKSLSMIGKPEQGMATADNNRFVRMWHEVAMRKTSLSEGMGRNGFLTIMVADLESGTDLIRTW